MFSTHRSPSSWPLLLHTLVHARSLQSNAGRMLAGPHITVNDILSLLRTGAYCHDRSHDLPPIRERRDESTGITAPLSFAAPPTPRRTVHDDAIPDGSDSIELGTISPERAPDPRGVSVHLARYAEARRVARLAASRGADLAPGSRERAGDVRRGALPLGLFTEPIAVLLAGEMAAAYFRGHAPNDTLLARRRR